MASAVPAFAKQDKIFSELQAIHPYSLPSAIATDVDGEFVFLGEGGALGWYRVETNGDLTKLKVLPIGSIGVRAVRMKPDPDADFAEMGGSDERLFIAGGRSGFWIMDADPDGTVNFAARVDDSGNLDKSTQNSRRWCCDLEFLNFDGTDYVAVLFAKRSQNRLRLYELEEVQNVLANAGSDGFGAELEPDIQVSLGSHPEASAETEAFAMSMTVDDGRDTIYVTLAEQGLVRVRFSPMAAPEVKYGPVFGDGTHYNTTGTGLPEGFDNATYKTFDYGPNPGVRSVAPCFIDVLYHDEGTKKYLYTTVNHLNWLRFDVTAEITWSHDMDIQHHEGIPRDYDAPSQNHEMENVPWGESHVPIIANGDAPEPEDNYTYARLLEIVDVESAGPVLVVTASKDTLERHPEGRTEGFVYSNRFNVFSGVENDLYNKVHGSHHRAVFYRISDLPTSALSSPAFHYQAFGDSGGFELAVPSTSAGTNLLDAFVVGGDPITIINGEGGQTPPDRFVLSLRADLTDPGSNVVERDKLDEESWPGRRAFTVLPSIQDSDVLLCSGNDGPIAHDGPLVTCPAAQGYEFVHHFDNPPDDERLTFGVNGGKHIDWAIEGTQDYEYYWGAGRLTPNDDLTFMMAKINVGTTPCNSQGSGRPDEIRRWFIYPDMDRFGSRGRQLFVVGETLLEYNNEHGGAGPVVWGATPGSAEGITLMDREDFEEFFDPNPHGSDMKVSQYVLAEIRDPDVLGFVTHPEFNWVDSSDSAATDPPLPINGELKGNVQTHAPTHVKVASPGAPNGDPDTWILAVPCGFSYAPDVPVLTSNGWRPPQGSEFYDTVDQLLVQFFEVDDPDSIPKGPVDDSWDPRVESEQDNGFLRVTTLPKIIGPIATSLPDGAPGNAWKIEPFTLEDPQGPDRVFVFIADFAGSVQVYEVTSLLTGPSVSPIAEWVPRSSLSDGLLNNVWDVAVERILVDQQEVTYVYVGVGRVGIEVLRFDPDAQEILEPVTLIQTPGEPRSIVIREDDQMERTLLVSDGEAGIRVYEYNQ